jgi:hypothetical protein
MCRRPGGRGYAGGAAAVAGGANVRPARRRHPRAGGPLIASQTPGSPLRSARSEPRTGSCGNPVKMAAVASSPNTGAVYVQFISAGLTQGKKVRSAKSGHLACHGSWAPSCQSDKYLLRIRARTANDCANDCLRTAGACAITAANLRMSTSNAIGASPLDAPGLLCQGPEPGRRRRVSGRRPGAGGRTSRARGMVMGRPQWQHVQGGRRPSCLHGTVRQADT